jgi:2,3-bisphosphoglycerate-dependent phosphoglycerate mutase
MASEDTHAVGGETLQRTRNSLLWWRMRSMFVLALVAACGGDDGAPGPDAAASADTKVFVVRHAEATADPNDPGLTAAGQTRADNLAALLADDHLAAVYTSQYRRTKDTGTPAATGAGITVTVKTVGASTTAYAADLAATVMQNPTQKAVLIVGHSNTVPETVKALSGTTVPAIADTEYNRLYIVTLAADGPHLESTTY